MKQIGKSFLILLVFSSWLAGESYAGTWEVPIVMDGATPITAEELTDLIKEMDNLVIIDTRKSVQNQLGAIAGSLSLPHSKTSPDSLSSVVPSKLTPVVFYCDSLSCPHSMKAIKKAVSYGYTNIFWFRGGITEWTEKGFPIVAN